MASLGDDDAAVTLYRYGPVLVPVYLQQQP